MRRNYDPLIPSVRRNYDPLIPSGEGELHWPEVGPDGLLAGVDMTTASFLWAWITQAARLQRDDPERAGEIRAALGFDPEKPLFNTDAILHD